MPWIRRTEYHECTYPADADTAAHGSLWECDECGRLWRYYRDDSMYRRISHWELVSHNVLVRKFWEFIYLWAW